MMGRRRPANFLIMNEINVHNILNPDPLWALVNLADQHSVEDHSLTDGYLVSPAIICLVSQMGSPESFKHFSFL